MQKLKMHSPNLTQENVARIRELFPNCVTEARDEDGKVKLAVDFDLLRQELSESIVEGPQERYRLDWPGKREALLTANAPIAKTLRPCREESVDFDTTKNLYIEGDNLDALKLLQETYLGKVKMIYIDPPYNTGKDFIYEDDFAENTDEFLYRSNQKDEEGNWLVANTESNGRFHSDWLSMMYPRLKLARNLLRDDGIIFISIDDNEMSNLTKMCDEIFGGENALSCYTIKVRYEGKILVEDMLFQKVGENILVYTKSKECISIVQEVEDYNYDKFIWDVLEKNPPTLTELGGKKVEIFNPGDFEIINKDADRGLLKEIWATGSILDGNSSGRFFRDHLAGRYRTDGLGVLYKVYGIGDDERPYRYFTGPQREGATKGKYFQGVPVDKLNSPDEAKKKKTIVTFLDLAADFGNCRHEGDVDFRSGKKPTILLRKLAAIVPWDQGDIILDFFSGSATTAHAVMQLNAEDSGNRQFIMVQLPEPCDEKSEAYKAGYKTIAEIGKERIRRAGAKIKAELDAQNSQNAQGSLLDANARRSAPLDIGFRVLKVDSSNMADVYYTPDTLNQSMLDMMTDNIKLGRKPEDLLFQVLLDWGVDLTLPIRKETILGKTVFFVDENALVACFDTGLTEELVKELARAKPLRVVFRDNGFSSDAVKINATQIFRQLSPGTEVKAI